MNPAETARLLFEAHEKGQISKRDLLSRLRKLINEVARENGYADRYGLPYQRRVALGRKETP
jgi:hypothetical protein